VLVLELVLVLVLLPPQMKSVMNLGAGCTKRQKTFFSFTSILSAKSEPGCPLRIDRIAGQRVSMVLVSFTQAFACFVYENNRASLSLG